jgi:alkyl sulfatase BDS1-like metallo-beta-lactamase superfamily hydrolase
MPCTVSACRRAGCARIAGVALAGLVLVACTPTPGPAPVAGAASDTVARAHAEVAATADLADPPAFADARRGFIAAPSGQVRDAAGRVVWDFDAYAFVKGAAPPTVNPSLWRQALLNNEVGLFEVVPGIWQLRGFDLANMTLVEGETGWIVIDALTARETAAAALAFARAHLGDRPVSALVFTHSHADHFGGALGVLSAPDAAARGVPVVAPAGFLEEATSENILVGTAMTRRAAWMYGNLLPKDPGGSVDTGLGKTVAIGSVGILPPTLTIDRPAQELVLDGRRFVFHPVPGAEAPSEFVFALPDFGAFCGAELMGQTLHNLYTLRGAKVRDGLKWAAYLDASLEWAAGAQVLFNQHHWPVWGEARIRESIERQRDAYKFIHDQSVRLMNAGLTAPEIAESLVLPKALSDHLAVRGYYGTVRHNAKAVYQHYLGWFDAHPSNLDPLPPVEAARRYVDLAGGAAALRERARAAHLAGEFRWAAELLKHAVYADPSDRESAALLADALEQMGYLAESATWRNVYLSGAHELRHGPPSEGVTLAAFTAMLAHAPTERFLERMAASIDGVAAADDRLRINLVLSDRGESHVLSLSDGVLHHRRAPPAADADATLAVSKDFFLRMMTGQAGAGDLLLSDEVDIEGDRIALARFLSRIEKADGRFPIVTP